MDQTEKPAGQQTANMPDSLSSRSRKNAFQAVGAVFIVLAAIAGTFFLSRWLTGSQPYHYKYTNLDSYTLPGSAAGSGMVFSKPKEFSEVDKLPATGDFMDFVHNITKNNKIVTLGYESASSVHVNSSPDAAYVKGLNDSLLDPNNVSHAHVIEPISNFLTSRINTRYTITLGRVSLLATTNIKSKAWEIDFNGVDKTPKTNTRPTRLTGKAILAVGQSTYYYFMVGSLDYNWQSNQKIWQQVIDSLKIDQ